jgi:hypothetical protein
MQMICSIFKVFVFLPVVFCRLGSDFDEWHIFQLCFLSLWWFQQSSSPNIVFMLLCSWYSWRWKCDGVEALVELNSQSAITVTSFWFESKSHPRYMHCLPSCSQINITHSGMNQMTASLLHGATCCVVWLAVHPEFYAMTSQNLQYFLIKFPFPKPVHVDMKSLPAHLPYRIVCYWGLQITSSFENLRLRLDTQQPYWRVGTDSEVEICLGRD